MGSPLALVCPYFRKNVIVTCTIVSVLCSLDTFLLKNVVVFICGKQILKWRSFGKKEAIFDLLFTFFSHQGEAQNSFNTLSHLHKYRYLAHPIDFFALPILENYEKNKTKQNKTK